MIYKKRVFLLVYILFMLSNKVDCSSEILAYSHSNNSAVLYDVTTIYKITNKSLHIDNVGFKGKHFLQKYNGSYSVKIHSRTNAIGLPIEKEINRNFPFNTILQMNTPIFFKYGLSQNTSRMKIVYDLTDWGRNMIGLSGDKVCRTSDNVTKPNSDKCYNVFEYKYDVKHKNSQSMQSQKILSIQWTPEKQQNCLAITYSFRDYSRMRINMSVVGENHTLIAATLLRKLSDITTLKVKDMVLVKDQKYELAFQVFMDIDYYNYNPGRYSGRGLGYIGFWFGILRIADCSNHDEEVRIVSLNESIKKHQRPESYSILGIGTIYKKSALKIHCFNGGFKKSKNSTCVCPPGFIGSECETGCGPNSYGADCKGVCSMHGDKMCRGMYMCTIYGCTCPAGLTGPLCNKECGTGKYGADCKQTCRQCYNNTCDPYTGACSQGCSPGYIQPNCTHKYPYLNNPPKLVSAKYDSITLKLNFQPSNVKGGYNSTKLKYYRLSYKTSRSKTYKNSEIKPIIEKKYRPKEVLSDLKPDTKYDIGVVLITDDGNVNFQDVVYGQYSTSCTDPKITDFDIQTTRAIKSINLSWKKINNNSLHCKIVQRTFTLSYDQSLNKTSETQTLKLHPDNIYNLKNLIPGYQYGVQVTLKTSRGSLLSSPIYTVTPLIGNDIKIKQINTDSKNETIKVIWNFGFKHDYFGAGEPIIDEPITSILRYKIQKMLSCSLTEELANDWNSVTIFNRTNYEILNTVPNAQYLIQMYVAVNGTDKIQQETTVFALTPEKYPNTAPILDVDHPIAVTNSSASVQWELEPSSCLKMNGFLSKFYIELKNMNDNSSQTIEIKKKKIVFQDLKSNTSYELKVFIKTHMGYNPEKYLLTKFTTKVGILKPIEDLMVYKKSLEDRMVGLRWSYSDNKNLVGFIVSFSDDIFTTELHNVSAIPPTKCLVWPNYYCYTFNNLSVSGNYTFNIKPKTTDYPNGRNFSSISFNISDAPPDSPNNMKIIDIGNTTIIVQWDIPWVFNGILTHFVVTVEEKATEDVIVEIPPIKIPFDEEVPTFIYTIEELKPETTYKVAISSVSTTMQSSSPAVFHATTIL